MTRRKEVPTSKGAPAWTTTFADLMNLLLCFFVLLFSMSTVDAEKFEKIASSFSSTIGVFSEGGTSIIGDGELIGNGISQLKEADKYIDSTGKVAENNANSDSYEKMQSELEKKQLAESEQLAEKISEALTEDNLSDIVNVNFTSQYVQLTMKGALLFDSGSATLKKEAVPTMEKIGTILERYAEQVIEIEGHTDNVPIHNGSFANNDVLSSFRALEVFDYFVENTTLDPAMIKHSGRGEYVPIADNKSEEGRAKNRRVEIKIYNALSTG